LPGAGVERAGRLVGEHDVGAGHERPGDRNALLLTARQLAREIAEPIVEADRADDRVEPGPVLVLTGQGEREQDVLLRGERGDQVVLLEDESEPVAAQQRKVGLVERRERGVADERLTRGQSVESGDALHQRALPGSRRPHDGGELVEREVDRDTGQRVDGGVALAVGLGGIDRARRCAGGRIGLGDHRVGHRKSAFRFGARERRSR
jgi:acyl-CoA thioesterase-1